MIPHYPPVAVGNTYRVLFLFMKSDIKAIEKMVSKSRVFLERSAIVKIELVTVSTPLYGKGANCFHSFPDALKTPFNDELFKN